MVPYTAYGIENIEPGAIRQMENACSLPVSVAGALMADAHQGYGLPIGGVLATDNAVIPYAVGVDIACRMRMTILDLPVESFDRNSEKLKACLSRETSFGVGSCHKPPLAHPVMEDARWASTPLLQKYHSKAREQLGTSGSGNHYVEFGLLELTAPQRLGRAEEDRELDGENGENGELPAGKYVAVLSHSGSRGTGLLVAKHYSDLAMNLRRSELPKEMLHLAWLNMDSDAGREYWAAMTLMGDYAKANHELIHKRIVRHMKAGVLAVVDHHHNFAWRERHAGRDVVVHRKGATPMPPGQFGVIPGTMADPCYVVRGKGNPESLCSASHGAGRSMSRSEAKNRFNKKSMKELLAQRGVTLMDAGVDECPLAYKDIRAVMDAQKDLVEVLAVFNPKIVRMAPGHERPED